MARYQYQALTGPVWTAAVAASLSWLPAGNAQPARTLPRASSPPRTVGVAQVYNPADLAWNVASARLNIQPRAVVLGGVLAPFQPPASFDPATLVWMPRGIQPIRVIGPLLRDATVLPPFMTPPFDPAHLAWMSRGQQPVRVLPQARPGTWSVVVAQVPISSFDPATLQWMPAGFAVPQRTQLRSQRDYTEVVAGLYDPAGLDWLIQVPRANLASPRAGPTWVLLSPLPIPPVSYDPSGLQWMPAGLGRGPRSLAPGVATWGLLDPLPRLTIFDPATLPIIQTVRWQMLPRALRGDVVQPFTAALYRPDGLQWLPTGRQPWRGLIPNRLGWVAGSALPIIYVAHPLQIEDRSGFLYALLDQSTKRYLAAEQSGPRYPADESSKSVEQLEDRSTPKLNPEDRST